MIMQRTARKAVDPIIASLLLIAIAVAAGIIVYVYVTSLAGGLTQAGGQQVSEQLSLDAYTFPSSGAGTLTVTVRNTGGSSLTLNAYFFDGSAFSPTVGSSTLSTGQTTTITQNPISALPGGTPTSGTSHSLKVITADGGTFVFTIVSGRSG